MKNSKFCKLLSLILTAVMFFQQAGFAQMVAQGASANNVAGLEKFRPLHMRYFSFDANKDSFNLFVDKADTKNISDLDLNIQTQEVFKYFLTGVSLSNAKFWVNLKPDAQDNIIDPVLEKTDIGRIFLSADVQLKKDLAMLTSPQTVQGKEYWNKLYQKADELFGRENVKIPTLVRPWIVPGEVIMRGTRESAYIYKANLKVMLESDYLKNSQTFDFKDSRFKALNDYAAELVREMFIPQLTKEVNNSKKYSDLRKVFYSLILAQYFKEEFSANQKSSYSRMINSNNLNGLISKSNWSKDEYFQAYQKSFKEGEYNIKEAVNGNRIKMYVSGGINFENIIRESTVISTLRGIYKNIIVFEQSLNRFLNGFTVGANRIAVPLAVSNVGRKNVVDNGGLIADDGDSVDGGLGDNFADKAKDYFSMFLDMFRDYDYRYTSKKPFDPQFAFNLSLAWADMAIEKAQKAGITNRTVVIARDARKIEQELIDNVVKGFRYRGLNVVFVAASGTNAVTSYSWAVQELKPLMGVFLTASHVSRPKEEIVRGFKVQMMNKLGGRLLSLTTKEIKQVSKSRAQNYVEKPETVGEDLTAKSIYVEKDINDNCIRFNTLVGEVAAQKKSLYDLGVDLREAVDPLSALNTWEKQLGMNKPLEGMKIVVDGAHTVSGMLAQKTFENLGAQVTLINGDIWDIEGEHNADPSKDKNLNDLKKKISEVKADFGMSFDLDGDRGAMVVPQDMNGETTFDTLAPDNLMTVLLPYLIKDLGYDSAKIHKNIGIIRDVLGTYGVNDKANQLGGVKVFQTDAGYVFLKAKREQLLDEENYVIPIYGERSGHCWLDVSGEIENPLAVAVLFATLVKKEKFDAENKTNTNNPVMETFLENTISYSQAPRFQPVFHPTLLGKLSNDPRNSNWQYDSNSNTNPPQTVIALGRDTGVAALRQAFTVGKIFNTPAGVLKVKEFNFYKDTPEDGDLYRFADIVFEDLAGKLAGRFVFRASSNDPTFVCSYETPILKGETDAAIKLRRASVGGIVLDWMQTEGYALITIDAIEKELKLTAEAAEKKANDMNLKPVAQDLALYKDDGGKVLAKIFVKKALYQIAGDLSKDSREAVLEKIDFRNVDGSGLLAKDNVLNQDLSKVNSYSIESVLESPFGKSYAKKHYYDNWLPFVIEYFDNLGDLKVYNPKDRESGPNPYYGIMGNFREFIEALEMHLEIGQSGQDSKSIPDELLKKVIVQLVGSNYKLKSPIETILLKIRELQGNKKLGDLSLDDIRRADGDGGKNGAKESRGGIDFTRIDILRQSLMGNARINFRIPEPRLLQSINLNLENQQLKNLMSKGMIPSSSRVIKYLSASILRNNEAIGVEDAYTCLTDYFKFAEDAGFDTDLQLKNFVSFIEAGR